jgi:hypothetical protein
VFFLFLKAFQEAGSGRKNIRQVPVTKYIAEKQKKTPETVAG